MNRFLAIPGMYRRLIGILAGPYTHLHDAVGHDDHAGEERPR